MFCTPIVKVPSFIEESNPTGLQKLGAKPDSISFLNNGDFGVSNSKQDKIDLNKINKIYILKVS